MANLQKEIERQRRLTKTAQDIGPPRPPEDPARRAEGEASFRRFMEIYFPNRFSLAWSPDHLQTIARDEEAIRFGGLFAQALPRGTGKTTIAEAAVIWAAFQGLHEFCMLLAVNATRAAELLQSIKTEFLTNDLLDADFNEITHPVRRLEDRANRSKGQHIGGEPTYIGWRKNEVVLPHVAPELCPWVTRPAACALVRVAGLTGGGVRGTAFTRPNDGRKVRPSLVVLDDPQDDESANSPHQCDTRHRLIHGAVLGMAGPKQKVTSICLCTVIRKGDLADRMLDRGESPLWTGQRYKLLNRFPDRTDLWAEYAERRRDEFRNGGDGHLATAWYGQHKELMDAGAAPAWPERFRPDELSAVQHAMNLFYLDEEAFWAEYQNEPRAETAGQDQLQVEEVNRRTNGLERGAVPMSASRLTAYVDVQQKVLYYGVAAWADGFTGSVIDYGTFPDQKRRYFTLADVRHTLGRAAPGAGMEGAIHAGLTKLADQLLGREWHRQDGAALRVERLLVDASWGASTDTVYAWCRQTPHAAVVMPAHGRYVGAASKPWSEYQKRPGERLGFHWMVPVAQGKRATRHVLLDVNFWKTFTAERLTQAVGDRGALTLFGKPGTDHRMFAEHCCAEYRVRTEGRGRAVDEWKLRVEKPDNHFWDVVCGCAAAASLQGVELAAAAGKANGAGPRKRVSYAELQRRKREGNGR